MEKFEYKVIYDLSKMELQDILNDLGNEGWEVISIDKYIVAKRKALANINKLGVKKQQIIPIDFSVLLKFINDQPGREFKIINKSVRAKFFARLKDGYTKEDIRNTIINACKDEYHKETNFKYITPEYLSRASTIDKFSNTLNESDKIKLNMNL